MTQTVSPHRSLTAAVVFTAAGLLACQAPQAETVTVDIRKMKFLPQEITIKKGDTVRWLNKERRQYHSVWFQQLDKEEPVDYFWPEESFERSFNQVGSFPYRCGPHEKMTGVVHVVE